jgi:hypothetical protein
LGTDTALDHNAYDLLPIRVADPIGLITEALWIEIGRFLADRERVGWIESAVEKIVGEGQWVEGVYSTKVRAPAWLFRSLSK